MTSATFVLMHKQPTDPVAAAEALKFFNWAYAKGGKMAEELDYVPMPGNVVNAVKKLWVSEIKDASGKLNFLGWMSEHLADSYEIAPDPMSVGIYVISSPGWTVLALVLIGNVLTERTPPGRADLAARKSALDHAEHRS